MKRIEPDQIAAKVAHEKYLHEGSLTFCILTLHCGFVVTGQTVHNSSAEYSKAKGNKIAYKDAISKLTLMERYHQSQLTMQSRGKSA